MTFPKTGLVILAAALILLGNGCASQRAQGGASGTDFEGTLQAQSSDDGESGMTDYREILSDPGRF